MPLRLLEMSIADTAITLTSFSWLCLGYWRSPSLILPLQM
ncbi:hypothetical protein NSP_30730 [Nodularia spumigena CCY9414]|nr:hypothetical protein NSP_30730 [Nodularia spumigena CCY9414]